MGLEGSWVRVGGYGPWIPVGAAVGGGRVSGLVGLLDWVE